MSGTGGVIRITSHKLGLGPAGWLKCGTDGLKVKVSSGYFWPFSPNLDLNPRPTHQALAERYLNSSQLILGN
jgi:hypothetical protein